MKRLLIAGCGEVGSRLANLLDDEAWIIRGLRRRTHGLPPSVRAVTADLLDPASLEQVNGHWDAIVYQAAPKQRHMGAYRETYFLGLTNLLRVASASRLIFVSSTGVYAQDAGEWVNESSTTKPTHFSGQALVEAERLCLQFGGTVVRFSGIYGPGRELLLRDLRRGRARCRMSPPQWTNRIHIDDCASVLKHLLELPVVEPIYCASDSYPAPRCEVLNWLAEQLQLPGPREDNEEGGLGKRVENHRLLDSGFVFQYPDFKAGYKTLL